MVEGWSEIRLHPFDFYIIFVVDIIVYVCYIIDN